MVDFASIVLWGNLLVLFSGNLPVFLCGNLYYLRIFVWELILFENFCVGSYSISEFLCGSLYYFRIFVWELIRIHIGELGGVWQVSKHTFSVAEWLGCVTLKQFV